MEEKKLAPKPSWYGPLMMLFSAILFSTGGILCKLIPWNALAINGVRNLISGTMIGIYILATHHKLKFNAKVLFGAICMFGVTTLYVLANKLTTAANTIVLQYSAPIWIIIMSAIILHKRPKKAEIITMAFVFIGIICFFIDSLGGGNIAGDAIALVSGIFYAGVFMLNAMPGGDSLSSLFIGQLGAGIILTPFVSQETDFSAVPIIAVLCLGLFQVGLAYIFFNLGTSYTSPLTAAIIVGVEPVLNSTLVAVFWHEMLKPLSLIGAVIVVATILIYNIVSARKEKA